MRILLLSQHFYPESLPRGGGVAFALELMRQGHEVEVLTSFPNYPGGKVYPGYHMRFIQREVIQGIRVTRLPLYPNHDARVFHRLLSYLSFTLAAAIIGPWVVKRPDVIHAYFGNATIGIPAVVISVLRRAPFVLDIQDLWPDTLTASRLLHGRHRYLIGTVDIGCKLLYRWSAGIAVLSDGLKQTLVARGVPAAKIQVIPNWCNEVQSQPCLLPPEEGPVFAEGFNVVMAGNMGTVQGLDVVLDAARLLAVLEPRVHFVLVGKGVNRSSLEVRAKALGLRNVSFLPARPIEEIGAVLHRADALLVHLKDDPLFAITVPSRIQAYLAVGRPILCGVRGNGAELVQQAEAGLCFQPDDPGALVDAVLALYRLPVEAREQMGTRGRQYYRERLSVLVGTQAFIQLFEQALQP